MMQRYVFIFILFAKELYFNQKELTLYFMKKAVIMGASSGIGREVALLLCQAGWHIGIAARRLDALHDIQAKYPAQVTISQIDVTTMDAPILLTRLVEEMGGIDLYVHVSGVGKQNPMLEQSIETATVDTNVSGFTRLIDTMFHLMEHQRYGHIAIVSSIAGTKGLGPAPSYSATKAYQATYIQALEQLAHSRRLPITFTDIRPGFVDTPLLSGGRYPMLMDKERVARAIVRNILARRHIVVIDWRYAVLTFFWRLIPNFIWRRMKLTR
ncbi:oxidoreductase, short chain dehydrogenase/reductase family protein [Prevotella sp. DNF00663]|nr:oxidoreductase, short chain dehydrogenase/reductase family protein [Prevotella sp. DNF00663]